ncbi:O-methyltransferase [Bordetella genomosp. 4]|uniref:O-methyltransferase n=1 Tax=Bordetella genomosp. 4 TaxID=463044 RepID=UPI000B9E8CEA|nr:O-methyltransferase [Bordetella genomosp. 4]OZI45984.1 methyltransferase [Bordetella genomosp. 4]
MKQALWNDVDDYFEEILHLNDPALEHALNRARDAGLPAHDVAPNQGRLLQIFAQMVQARRILEVGTLGGYSTIWLARALPASGKLISLERNAAYADVARANLAATGLANCTEIVVGDARDILQQWAVSDIEPFDMIFLDADKADNPRYLELALHLARDGTIIVGDNIVRGGRIADPEAIEQADVLGARRFLETLGHDLRLTSTAIQTVGIKGWDGFSLARVSR